MMILQAIALPIISLIIFDIFFGGNKVILQDGSRTPINATSSTIE
jgi:hypothetical protein